MENFKMALALAQGFIKFIVVKPNQYELVNWVLVKYKYLGVIILDM